MPNLKEILVEGSDDQNVVKNLLSVRGIVKDERNDNDPKNKELPKCVKKSINDARAPQDDVIYVVDTGGIDTLLDSLQTIIMGGQTTHLAIVIDADADLARRWSAVSDRLARCGVNPATIPAKPNKIGTILQSVQPTHRINIGVWLMPNNQIEGMLEDFLGFVISDPNQKRLWNYVTKVQTKIPAKSRFFRQIHESKAKIHAWLAWQDEPGKPLGQAITRNYINATHPDVDIFVTWLRTTLQI